MNQREAKRFVCGRVAAILDADTNLVEGAIYEECDDAKRSQIRLALEDLADELRRRGEGRRL